MHLMLLHQMFDATAFRLLVKRGRKKLRRSGMQ
jgi:hypothetical protein